jgi:ActR/RegA family two-component response regulator
VEKEHIEKVLKATGNNISKAARILEISRPTLRKKNKRVENFFP